MSGPAPPAPVRHSFLLEPAVWLAAGLFMDGAGATRPAAGEVEVRHLAASWQVRSLIRIETARPGSLQNSYEVAPWRGPGASTPWRAVSPTLGPILGRFVLIEDTILSTWSTEDGRYQGGETFRLEADGHYENRGWLALGAEVGSRWRLRMERKE